jgi:hypothetical protein
MIRRAPFASILLSFAIACPADEEPAQDAGDTTAVATSSGATSSSGGDPSTGADGSSTTGPVGDGVLQCVETCSVPLDCCIPGEPCPGPYPYNVDCIGGLCRQAVCVDDAECEAYLSGTLCREVRGLATCVLQCADEAPCEAAGLGTCSGTDDAGATYCLERCDAPGAFCGNQTCDAGTGLCTCSGDGQCQSDWRCVD